MIKSWKTSYTAPQQQEQDISIRGRGDRLVIVAQNFAPGTTSSDIESVMAPDPAQCLISSRLVAMNPTVIAELTFGSRTAAEEVVQRFNNKYVCLTPYNLTKLAINHVPG